MCSGRLEWAAWHSQAPPLLNTIQLAGSSPGDVACASEFSWRVEGSVGSSQDWPTQLVVLVTCGGQVPLALGFFSSRTLFPSSGPGSVTSGFFQLKILVCCFQSWDEGKSVGEEVSSSSALVLM